MLDKYFYNVRIDNSKQPPYEVTKIEELLKTAEEKFSQLTHENPLFELKPDNVSEDFLSKKKDPSHQQRDLYLLIERLLAEPNNLDYEIHEIKNFTQDKFLKYLELKTIEILDRQLSVIFYLFNKRIIDIQVLNYCLINRSEYVEVKLKELKKLKKFCDFYTKLFTKEEDEAFIHTGKPGKIYAVNTKFEKLVLESQLLPISFNKNDTKSVHDLLENCPKVPSENPSPKSSKQAPAYYSMRLSKDLSMLMLPEQKKVEYFTDLMEEVYKPKNRQFKLALFKLCHGNIKNLSKNITEVIIAQKIQENEADTFITKIQKLITPEHNMSDTELQQDLLELLIMEDQPSIQKYCNSLLDILIIDFLNSLNFVYKQKKILKYVEQNLRKIVIDQPDALIKGLNQIQMIKGHISEQISKEDLDKFQPTIDRISNLENKYSELISLYEKLYKSVLCGIEIIIKDNLTLKIPKCINKQSAVVPINFQIKTKELRIQKGLFEMVTNYTDKETIHFSFEEGSNLKKIVMKHIENEQPDEEKNRIENINFMVKIVAEAERVKHELSEHAKRSADQKSENKILAAFTQKIHNLSSIHKSKLESTENKFEPIPQIKNSPMEHKSYLDCFLARLLYYHIVHAKNSLKTLGPTFDNYEHFEKKFDSLKNLLFKLREKHRDILNKFCEKSAKYYLTNAQKDCYFSLQLLSRHTTQSMNFQKFYPFDFFLKNLEFKENALNLLKKCQKKLSIELQYYKNKRSKLFDKLKTNIYNLGRVYLEQALTIVIRLEEIFNLVDLIYSLIAYIGAPDRIILFRGYFYVQNLTITEKELLLGLDLEEYVPSSQVTSCNSMLKLETVVTDTQTQIVNKLSDQKRLEFDVEQKEELNSKDLKLNYTKIQEDPQIKKTQPPVSAKSTQENVDDQTKLTFSEQNTGQKLSGEQPVQYNSHHLFKNKPIQPISDEKLPNPSFLHKK